MKVAVICGGKSAEREVSLVSGREIAHALRDFGYDVVTMDVTHTLFHELQTFAPDVVFIGLHGRLGEDGTVQGALELLGIPYVGSGVLASALAIDKAMTKRVLTNEGIPVPKGIIYRGTGQEVTLAEAKRIGDELGWPLIIKPNKEGSTIGLTLAGSAAEFCAGIHLGLLYDQELIIEQYISGMEVTVVVTGEPDDAQVLGVIEIVPKAALYDYESKYSQGGSEHILPARLPALMLARVEAYARQAYQLIGCRDYARVDFIVSDQGPVLLEVNTLPGMTPTSLVPDAARHRGISFGTFLDGMVQLAYHRAHQAVKQASVT